MSKILPWWVSEHVKGAFYTNLTSFEFDFYIYQTVLKRGNYWCLISWTERNSFSVIQPTTEAENLHYQSPITSFVPFNELSKARENNFFNFMVRFICPMVPSTSHQNKNLKEIFLIIHTWPELCYLWGAELIFSSLLSSSVFTAFLVFYLEINIVFW